MIKDYLRAGYPAICLLTQEPHRAETVLPCEGWSFTAWDCLQGFRTAENGKLLDEVRDPVEAIHWLSTQQDSVLLAHNLHLFLEIPEVIQAVQNGVVRWKSIGCCLVMVCPTLQLRPEIEKLFHIIAMPLPGESDLFSMQQDLAKGVSLQDTEGNALPVEADTHTARAAKGLTEFEAETAFALSLVKKGRFDQHVITEVKAQMIKKSGLMEFWEPADISRVGGLGTLKAYIRNRATAFLPGNEHLPKPKGVMLVGIPGTGKSLASKATASILGWPLIRLDISALKNSLVGESERRMRQATGIIEAFGEAVVWVDEIEKSLAGSQSSGQTDSGVTASMLGHLLTWMQETTAPILMMATANSVGMLPPELLRAGRFDAVFFVDLPGSGERLEIIRIMNEKYEAAIPEEMAARLDGFTGAEIEQIAKDSLFDGLDAAMSAIVPLSRTMREEIQSLREWARTRARPANTPEDQITEQRKIRSI
ncbi:AAA family ATPase [Desulforhabdus sp. TSK]|uniref:AAA family ATPase n=1 Tax=Desulforhabdus sp. TSK TaxID=2925014 RepID=UPI001FC7FA77|nr:AAA family ATPase [Desulforhabdus sp. TSK]GKT09104.1 ATPase AAA [Desulforhabdus sp. TSK]